MIDLLSLFPAEIEQLVDSLGEKRFRADQIFGWLYRGASDFSDMKNIPARLTAGLAEKAYIPQIKTVRKLVSKLDGTVKYLFEFADGERVESVVMRYKHGNTLCLSTQAGCRMGCKFCASTENGLVRNLRASEMLLQVLAAQNDIGERISNLVLMGIGEPLDNYDNVVRFLRLVNLPTGLNIGLRHISLSTCGLADRIKKLAGEGLPVTLSVSLHAANDDKRQAIMPIARKWPLEELLAACDEYAEKTGRRVCYEYAMISGVNDTYEDAKALSKILSGRLCHLNLIPVNPVAGKNFEKSEKKAKEHFTRTLEKDRISVTVRRTLGSDINAACGQLRAGSNE